MPRLTSSLTGTYVKSLEAPLPFLYGQTIKEKVLWAKFGFLWNYFFSSPLKVGFFTNIKATAAVTLHFEDLVVKNYLF